MIQIVNTGRTTWLLFLCVIAVCHATHVTAAKPPNVILILADDMALGDMSCFNGGVSRTPNLDRLKEESVWFHQAYSASPVCAPARAALLTGRYPHRTGVVTLNMERFPALTRLKTDEVTMADVFRANGYVTGLIGKWHLGIGRDFHPLSRGFDEFEGFIGHLHVPSYFDYVLDIGGETKAFPDRYLTHDLSERAVKFVQRHREGPFFLHLAHYAPHRPIEAPDDKIQPYLEKGLDEETATVYAMIEVMDEGIGELLEELERLKIAENTIVVFASDNGPDSLVKERFNVDLLGTKYLVNEGGIRVPFMVRWKGQLAPDEVHEMIHFIDVLPTLGELCGLKLPIKMPLDGSSFAPLLRGQEWKGAEYRFWQWNRGLPRYSHNAAVREGDWKLVRPFVTKNMPKGNSKLAS
ncbi:MAG: sulfatase-like hydrolase/transferase, partial [Verrucomicrobiota bacterium]